MKQAFLILACTQMIFLSLAIKFKPEWHQYIANLIRKHERHAFSPVVIIPQFPAADGNTMSVDHFFLPEVIIWDPLQQFPAMIKIVTCNERGCGSEMKLVAWQDGSVQRLNPRCLYGSRGCVVLVCKIYRCPKGHLLTSCDIRVLQQIGGSIPIPFILLHKCGVSRELQWTIFHLCSKGMSFADIESLILSSVQDHYAQQVLNYKAVVPSDKQNCILDSIPEVYISNDLITNIFLITYNMLKCRMTRDMCELTSEYISCDHTFKVASHIGIFRDRNWISQYDSLFIIQDNRGAVLFWQLAKGNAYDSLHDGMLSLNARITNKEKSVKMIIIDNCCMWRKKLSETFGEATKVKLDLFHAIKRVSTALSKKHAYFYTALQDFRLVFREVGDNGSNRKQATPPPDAIQKKLELFLSKWNMITDENGKHLITSAVICEIDKLRIPIERGCLSEIPPHFGTNRNENIHRSLNKRLAGTRLGVEVAVALLATFFHLWNSKRMNVNVSTIASQIDHSNDSNSNIEPESFGISVSALRSCTVDDVQEEVVSKTSKELCSDSWSIMKSIHLLQDKKCIYRILCNALSFLHAEELLNGLSDTHCKVSRMIQCQIGDAPIVEQSVGDDVRRLENILLSFKMKMIDVPHDGDCLFTSVAKYLRHIFKELDCSSDIIQHVHSLGISPERNSSIQTLRHLLVNEWLLNRQDYQPFFHGISSFAEEAEKYRVLGVHNSSLGDAMLLGLSNLLHLQMVLFMSIPSWPHTTVSPRDPPLCQVPMYLAYNHTGSGHYALVLPEEPNEDMNSCEISHTDGEKSRKFCRCGRGRNAKDKNRINCCNQQAYSSRCPCLRSNSACSETCQCIGCGNTFGSRSNTEQNYSVGLKRRKRARYPEQDCLKKTGWKYMKTENELPLSGIWTPQEHYVFYAIVLSYRNNGELLEIGKISNLYSTIKENLKQLNIPLFLAPKTNAQVRSKLQQLFKEEGIFNKCGNINY